MREVSDIATLDAARSTKRPWRERSIVQLTSVRLREFFREPLPSQGVDMFRFQGISFQLSVPQFMQLIGDLSQDAFPSVPGGVAAIVVALA